jgi:hypothetical protein
MFIRKTTEFFKPPGNGDKNDTLYAWRYLPEWKCVWVVDETDYNEMHKRVGHITVMEARCGKRGWPIGEMTLSSLHQWMAFFRDLRTSPIYEGSPSKEELRGYQITLQTIADGCR